MHRRRRASSARTEAARFVCIAIALHHLILCHAAEEESSNDGSGDNQANEYVAEDDWADDFYLQMIDDAVRHQLDAQIEQERNAERYQRQYATHEIVKYATSISMSILGVASAIFCTAVSLYFLRVDALMRWYSEEGVEVDGQIVASVPDIHEAMKKIDKGRPNPDSYSMMTDDGSYRLDSDSGSDGSGQEPGKKDNNSDQKVEIVNEQDQQPHVIARVSSAKDSMSKSRQRASNKEHAMSEGMEDLHSESFRILARYDDISSNNGINETSSATIHKRLLVAGEDIIETLGKDLHVKLYVLPDRPKSGYPSGEVERALRWEKRILANMYIMFGFALVLAGTCAAGTLLSPKLFQVYVGVLVCQVPLVACFLYRSFSKIISDRYLDNGKRISDDRDRDKTVAALRNGTSFGSFA